MSEISDMIIQMTEIYERQKVFYEELLKIAVEENAVIARGDTLRFIELLRMEEELLAEVQLLDEAQKQIKNILLERLPGRRLSMDQLACLAEPRSFVRFKAILGELKVILFSIEQQKSSNILNLDMLINPLCGARTAG